MPEIITLLNYLSVVMCKTNYYILGGDEVVVSKSGKATYGLDFFYSSIHNKVIKSIMFLNISLIDVTSRKAYPLI